MREERNIWTGWLLDKEVYMNNTHLFPEVFTGLARVELETIAGKEYLRVYYPSYDDPKAPARAPNVLCLSVCMCECVHACCWSAVT